ncbi:MAG: KH domain-containing protein [Epsilonproteobacteria bacterium]|nr:MAG: KH domain-containing protein [Campylobacterota bacterium]
MITEFVSTYAKMIVSNPDEIEVELSEINETFFEVIVTANDSDIGKLIGKNGNMINAIKTILNGCKAKDGISYKIQIVSK